MDNIYRTVTVTFPG